MQEYTPEEIMSHTFLTLPLDQQLAVTTLVAEVYARQTKYPNHNPVAYMAHLAQKIEPSLRLYVFTIYLEMWNR